MGVAAVLKLNAIDRVIIAVKSLDLAHQHYQSLLGRSCSEQSSDTTLGVDYVRFRLLNCCIELLSPQSDLAPEQTFARSVQERLDVHDEGIFGIVFSSSSIRSDTEALINQGINTHALMADEYTRDAPMVQLDKDLSLGLAIYLSEPADRLGLPFAKATDLEPASGIVDELDHLVLNTQDSEQVKAFFGERLGLSLRLDQTREEWGVRQLFFRLGANILEVMEFLNAEHKAKSDYFWGLALNVPNLDSSLQRLDHIGVACSVARKGRKKHTKVATVKSHTCGAATLLISQESG